MTAFVLEVRGKRDWFEVLLKTVDCQNLCLPFQHLNYGVLQKMS
jgi:hypothetical protein